MSGELHHTNRFATTSTASAELLLSSSLNKPPTEHKYESDFRYLDKLGLGRGTLDRDLLSFSALYGLTVSQREGEQNKIVTELIDLNSSEEALRWLEGAEVSRRSGDRTLKLFWTRQVYIHDALRGLQGTGNFNTSKLLPKDKIVSCLGLPGIAIEKMGSEIPVEADYSTHLLCSTTLCYGINTQRLSALWSYEASTRTTSAFFVSGMSAIGNFRDRILTYVKDTSDLYHLPTFIPYVITTLQIDEMYESVSYHEREAFMQTRELSKFLYHNDPLMALSAASVRTDMLLSMRRYVPLLLKMIQRDIFRTKSIHHAPSSNLPCAKCDRDNDSVLQALEIRSQELESLQAGIESLQRQTDAQVTSILGLVSFHQQKAAQELATVSAQDNKVMKEIAAATKKDSTSMKVLALMTVIFLPSTATSAIMAIPNMFNFEFDAGTTTSQSGSGDGRLVNPRFWIFFAVALPLTFITMTLTLFWLKWEDLGRPLTFNRSVISKILPPWSWRGRAHLVPSSSDAGKIV